MLPEAAGRGQHFQARGHSFSPYGPTLSRQITCFFFSYDFLRFVKNLGNERVTQIVDKERCIQEQTFFELLYVSCIYFTGEVL